MLIQGCLVLCLLATSPSPRELELELDYARRLREQQLFRLSWLHCRRLLDDESLDERARVQVVSELSQSLAAGALHSRSPRREELWREARDVVDQALAAAPEPWRVLLRTRQAMIALMQAEWSVREAEVMATKEMDWEPARTRLRAAIAALNEVAGELDDPAWRAAHVKTLTESRWELLRRNVHYQLARGYWNQAITHAGKAADRIQALTLAKDELDHLRVRGLTDELVWKGRLDRIRCHRLLEEYDQAASLIRQFSAEDVPAAIAGPLLAEAARLKLATGSPEEAATLLDAAAERDLTASAEVQLAHLETLVARADAASADQRREHQQAAARLAASLETNHGAYWAQRGEMLIARLAQPAADTGTGNIDLLTAAARSYLRRNLPGDAVEMFMAAAGQAEAAGDEDQAFQFRRQAAAVWRQQGELQAAIDGLRQAALRHAARADAARTHLLGVYDAAALYQQQASANGDPSSMSGSLRQYQSLLEEHLRQWPRSQTADQARLWLGRLHQARREWDQAIRQFRAISITSDHVLESYSRLVDIHLRVFDGADAQAEPRIEEARQWFDQQARLAPAGGKTSIEALLAAARLRLWLPPHDYLGVDRELQPTLTRLRVQSPDARRLRALVAVAAAGRSQMSVAQTELARALPLDSAALVDVLRGLQPIHDARQDDEELRQMMARAARLLAGHREQLSADDQQLLRATETDVLAAVDLAQAVTMYASLAEESPRDARIQQRYAALLSRGPDRTTLEAALSQWRRIVEASPARSPHWFRAKLGIAQVHFDLGRPDRTREMIQLLASLHPGMGGPELKREFMRLLDRCPTTESR